MQNNSTLHFSSTLKNGFVLIMVLYIFNVFTNLPIENSFQFISTGFFILQISFLAFYVMKAIKSKQVNLYLLIITPILLIPFIAALKANYVFGQPFLYGFSTERYKLNCVLGLMLIFLLENSILHFNQLKKAMINASYGVLFIFLFLYLLVDPSLFVDTNLVVMSPSKGAVYKLGKTLLLFLYFFSLAKSLKKPKPFNFLVMALVILVVLFFAKARSLSLSVFITTFLFVLWRVRLDQKIILLSFLSVSIPSFMLLLYLFYSEEVSLIQDLFYSAFNVFFGGDVTDSSAASRVSQFKIAYSGFLHEPLLGNGSLSHRWKDGFNGVYGHFYPSDIGWMGIIFSYGVLGFLLLKMPFLFLIKFRGFISNTDDPFLLAIFYTLIFLFLHGITAGYEISKTGMILFLFAILYYQYHKSSSLKTG
jgi:hypothetical protein